MIAVLLMFSLSVPAAAAELTAPRVPASGLERMPDSTDSLGKGLEELLQKGICLLQPELKEAMGICSGILVSAVLFSIVSVLSDKVKGTVSIAGAAVIATGLFRNTNALIGYACDAVWEICEYGKLLCPVMTTALAAQGGITASAALYSGTIAYITLQSILVSRVFLPMIRMFLVFSTAHCALGDETLKRIADAIKGVQGWMIKTMLIMFTTYLSLTGVVSGTTDAAALKAAKVTISSAVPVVGGILSDASESILVSMSLMKNAAGIYGIFAVLAIFLVPFLKIGVHYIVLKGTFVMCSVFSSRGMGTLLGDFSTAMGLLLAMTGSACLIQLISTVCFLKGVGS
jgi:stage III sporulation protein AE